MTRTAVREIAVRLSFSMAQCADAPEKALDAFFDREYYDTLGEEDELYSSYPNAKQMEYIRKAVTGVYEHRDELDRIIEKYSKGWKIHRISKTAAAILRVAIYEMLYMEDVPVGAAINEAVELAKGYEEKETVSFINGILGSFARAEMPGEPVEVSDVSEAAAEAPEDDAPAKEEE